MRKWTVLLPAALLLACHDSPRDNPLDPELTSAVELTVVADDTLGTATLQWSPYAGGSTRSWDATGSWC